MKTGFSISAMAYPKSPTSCHRIYRQVLEITIPDPASAWRVQDQLSSIQRQRLEPLIGRCLSECGGSSRGTDREVQSIQSLVVDLGVLDLARLEDDLADRLGPALRRALQQHLEESTQPTGEKTLEDDCPTASMASKWELVEGFLRTGSLPWWAQPSQPDVLESTVTLLIQQAPSDLSIQIRRLPEEPCRRRLVLNTADSTLADLAVVLFPRAELTPTLVLEALSSLSSDTSRAPWDRRAFWHAVLATTDHGAGTAQAFWQELLEHLSAIHAPSSRAWIAELLEAHLESRQRLPGVLAEALAKVVAPPDQRLAETPSLGRTDLPEPLEAAAKRPTDFRDDKSQNATDDEQGIIPTSRRPAVHPEPSESAEFPTHTPGLDSEDPASAFFADLGIRRPASRSGKSERLGAEEAKESLASAATRIGRSAAFSSSSVPLSEVTTAETGEPLASATTGIGRSTAPSGRSERLSEDGAEATEETLAFADTGIGRSTVPSGRSERLSEDGAEATEEHAVEPDLEAHPGRARAFADLPEGTVDRLEARQAHLPSNRRSANRIARSRASHPGENQAESLDTETAGLVLLWPFLGSFLEHLDLVSDGRFPTVTEQQRAVALVHYLATADPDPPEYQVILAKVLCGLEPEEVFDAGPPVTPEEADECTRLLDAVIQHATILNDMSRPGFRDTFLLRRGILHPAPGAWLLRVERQSFDVVLDRFPWSREWVKLPFMAEPLQVDW